MFEGMASGAGHAQQIAECGQDDAVPAGHIQKGGNFGVMRHADRAARAGHQLNGRRQQGGNPVSVDFRRVGAAHFHEAHASAGNIGKRLLQSGQQAAAECGVGKAGKGMLTHGRIFLF